MKRRGPLTVWSITLVVLVLVCSQRVLAACETPVGKFVSLTGTVDVQASGGGDWGPARLDTRLCEGDTIRVGERSRTAVALINNAVLRISQNTTMRLIDITDKDEERSLLDLFRGAFQSFSRKPKFLKVNTPYLNGSVEGTEFQVKVDADTTYITVFEGVVLASNEQGEIALKRGEKGQAGKGQAPQRRILVNPRDEVQWALHYPPILSAAAARSASPAVGKAGNCVANGNVACAFAALDGAPAAERDAQFFIYRAAVLLSVGRVDEARTDIDAALREDPQAGTAYALRSVIGVVQNRREAALKDARRGVELSPDLAAASTALSYALQANLQLPEARAVSLAAVERTPEDALSWARLAELQLSLGERRAASEAAQRAVQLQPWLSRAQNVLGFTALAEIKIDTAMAAFEQAIELDSADPLPRLGIGLAKIRKGRLEEGRGDIEAAVALDSNNALLRAYLGKAYFEEKRGPLDAQQFEIAKELDPSDPTAYFYNAIGLQSGNQPIAALRELEASIERNDNRAVYRGRLLLDQDRAARGTSQARVYNEVGFTNLGLAASTKSLTLDPSNASAHRFLSDSYQSVRRREISRVSELLQAQMLQDININPVQPSSSETNLNTVTSGGPSSVGFNEFTPLFERNGAQFNVTGLMGNNETRSGEAVLSGIYDRLSLSAGAYHYESDGWRPNNQLEQDVYNIYAQAAITPELNVQAEFRRRESNEGDLAFNFDPESYDDTKTVERKQETTRLGLRYSPGPNSNLLLSYIYSDGEETANRLSKPTPVQTITSRGKGDIEGEQVEAQYIYQQERFNLIAGLANSDVDNRISSAIIFTPPIPPLPCPPFCPPGSPLEQIRTVSDGQTRHPRGYLYTNLTVPESIVVTLGASYDDYEQVEGGIRLKESGFNPKAGLQWRVNEALSLRAAAFKVLKPALVANRSLEPTQVAGFNQLFDDRNATKSTRYGVGFDSAISASLTFGGELTWRDMAEPAFDTTNQRAVFEDRDEQLHRAYLYWTPLTSISVTAEFVYDRYTAAPGGILSTDSSSSGLPEKVETVSLPIGVRYFSPTGVYAGLGGTYVYQKVVRFAGSSVPDGSDNFFLVDAAVGYRLPRRLGLISLEVKNLFDRSFNYQDDSYREFREEPSTGPYFPERAILGQVLLNF